MKSIGENDLNLKPTANTNHNSKTCSFKKNINSTKRNFSEKCPKITLNDSSIEFDNTSTVRPPDGKLPFVHKSSHYFSLKLLSMGLYPRINSVFTFIILWLNGNNSLPAFMSKNKLIIFYPKIYIKRRKLILFCDFLVELISWLKEI
jgi:hypothetical protein